ncbi:MAG TPA: TetR/AcrR family transcriptional regulator [Ktedonobacterales bacterium]
MPKISAAAKEARQEQILQAALHCFAQRGYYATTIEDLVTATGLSRGALYLYFPSKEALYLALADRWSCGLETAIRARVTPGLSPAAVLRIIIEVTGAHVAAEADACRVLMEGWILGRTIPTLAEQVESQEARTIQIFEQLLQAGVASGEMRANLAIRLHAQMLLATLQGLMIQWHLHPGTIDWQRVADDIVRGLCPAWQSRAG